jgi:hypothetical protein
MFRFGSLIYFLMFFSFFKKKITYIVLIFIILFYLFLIYYKKDLPAYQIQLDIRFRSFDNVYNFIDFDFPFAQILRGIMWPVIRITGLAVLFHPIYFLFLLQSVALMYIIYVNRRYVDYRIVYFIFSMMIVAPITSGYNTYLRYSEPLVTIFPIWLAALPSKYVKKFKK